MQDRHFCFPVHICSNKSSFGHFTAHLLNKKKQRRVQHLVTQTLNSFIKATLLIASQTFGADTILQCQIWPSHISHWVAVLNVCEAIKTK